MTKMCTQHPAAAPHTPSSARRGATHEIARRMDRARPRARARPPREGGLGAQPRRARRLDDRPAAPRRRAPATQHSAAHRGHRPQRRVRVGRVRGRACAASRRGLLRTPLSLRGANALPLSASAWPTRPSRSRGHTPQSRARMRPRGFDAREHTVRRRSATRPPPAGREGQGRAPSQACLLYTSPSPRD